MEDKYKCLITHFCREFSFVAITRFLGGHFGPKFGGWGHTNIFKDRGLMGRLDDLGAGSTSVLL